MRTYTISQFFSEAPALAIVCAIVYVVMVGIFIYLLVSMYKDEIKHIIKRIMRLKTKFTKRFLAAVLTIAALAAGHTTAWAASTFTVTASGNTFTVTRTTNTSATEKVLYRTVSLSAIAGQHFTEASGELTFDANNNTRSVTVTESTPSGNAYKYQDITRTYRFEVTDLGGYYLAHCNRVVNTGTTVSSYLFSEKTATIESGEFTVTEGGYNQSGVEGKPGNPYTINGSSFYTDNDKSYLSFLSAQLRMTLEFKAKEVDDGYQYLQVLANNTTGYDSENAASGGDPGTPSVSRYMAGFEISHSSTYTTYKTYTFPILNVSSDAGATNPWSHGDGFNLSKQKFNTNCRATDGKIILPTNLNSISVRFDASGSGNDNWMVKELKAKVTAVETTAPTKLGDPVVAPGHYGAGTTVYISVPFSEIVTVSGTPYLHTDWGDFNYFSGSGSNVLTFSGAINADIGTSLVVRTLNGTVTDLAGNAFSTANNNVYKEFSVLTVALPWGGSGTQTDPYVITTAAHLDYMATRVNATYGSDNFSGKYFVLDADIAYTATTDWDGYLDNTSENNFTPIGGYGRSFGGHFDGQGHTVSGIRVNKQGENTDERSSVGLFGYLSGGTVSNIVLRDSKFQGSKNVGGIVGFNSGTVTNCTLYHVLAGTTFVANYVSAGAGIVVGHDGGTVTGCYYRDCRVGTTYREETGLGGSAFPMVHNDRKDNVYTVTAATGVSATYDTGTTLTIDDVTYYAAGSTFSLARTGTLPAGKVFDGFSATKGTISGDALSGYTFTMSNADCTVSPKWTSAWTGSGTSASPYIITTTDKLDLLAKMVNGSGGYGYSDFSGIYFKLGNDITYTHTTDWDDATGTENNYRAIGGWRSGSIYNQFNGTFDGDGHTISGIRIYKGDSGDTYSNQGLFGFVGTGGTVTGVTLADTRITGNVNVGGIAGVNKGTIQNCTVSANVLVAASATTGNQHGGIAGKNSGGTITGCTVSATVTAASTGSKWYGAVAGTNESGATISNCLAVGATVPVLDNRYGVIVGANYATLTANYYTACTVGTTANAVNVGAGSTGAPADVTENDGAVSVTVLSDTETVPADLSGKVFFNRTFKGGVASTICLPFAYTKGDEGTYYTFGGITKTIVESQPVFTATMNEVTAEALSANTPYLFVASGEGDKAVTFTGTAAATISAGESESGLWKFKGTYSRLTYGTEPMTGYVYGFASSNKTVEGKNVQAGEFVRAMTGAGVPPFRCYLIYNDGAQYKVARGVTRGETEELPSRIIVRLVGADGSTTAIATMDTRSGEVSLEGWYDLNGRKLNGMPTRKGIYIHNGKKVIR